MSPPSKHWRASRLTVAQACVRGRELEVGETPMSLALRTPPPASELARARRVTVSQDDYSVYGFGTAGWHSYIGGLAISASRPPETVPQAFLRTPEMEYSK